jgi:O-antigen ligase
MSFPGREWTASPGQEMAVVGAALPVMAVAGAMTAVLVANFGPAKVIWVLAVLLGGIWAMGDRRRTAVVLVLALSFPFRTKLLFGLQVHTTQLLLIAIAGLGIIELALRRRQVPRGLVTPMTLMVAGALIASVAGPYPGDSLLRTLWGVALPLLAALFLAMTLDSGRNLRPVVMALAGGVAAESLIAILQAAGKAPAIFPMWEKNRAVGLFLHPNILGDFLMAALLILIGVATFAWRRAALTAALLVPAVLLGVGGLVVTESRGALIGLAAGLAVLLMIMFVRRQAVAILTLLAFIALTLVVVVPRLPAAERAQFAKRFNALSQPGAEAGRERIYAEARYVLSQYPLTGVGPLTFGEIGSTRSAVPGIECCLTHSHSLALETVLSLGPLGTAGFIWLAVGSWVRLQRVSRRRRDPITAGWAIGVMSALSGLVVAGMFDFVFWQPEMLVLLLLLLASGYALVRDADRRAVDGVR